MAVGWSVGGRPCALPGPGYPQTAEPVFASRHVNTRTTTDAHTEPGDFCLVVVFCVWVGFFGVFLLFFFFNSSFIER